MKLTLSEWEQELRLQIAGGDVLLGQLPLGGPPYDEADMESLGHLLKKEFARRPANKVLGIIEKRYPLSFALYLVLQGVFNYQRGEYWPAVASELSLADGNSYAACGQTFRQILKKYGLPTFEHIEGLPNLVPILFHGGIPNYSLGDFFQLLDRSTKDSLIAVDAETLLEEWSNDPDETLSLIDRPVKRFVLHGGSVAEDFVSRCLALIELETAEEIAELALPQRVVNGYRDWREQQTDSQLRRDRIQLSRPVLYLDPYEGDGVCLELPPQRFPANIAFQSLTWLMEAGGKQREILCDRDRTANGYEFSVPETVLVPASSDYTISIRRDGVILRTWVLAGMGTPPLLIFDRGTGNLLKDHVRCYPGERWVVYPDDFRLIVKGGRKTGELPQQFGEWGRYAVEEWDLAPGSKLELTELGQPVHSLDIIDEPALRRPFFEGGFRPLEHRTRGKFALYSGPPPNLVITFPTNPDRQQLARWRITVASEGSSRPANRRSYVLSELHPQLPIENNNRVVLNLSSPLLLGQDPCGTFEINAQGPFGRGGRLGLRIVPDLRIQGHKALYLSAKDGPAKLELECAGHSRIQCTVDSGVEFEALPGATHHYKVTVTPSVPAVKFIFIDRQEVRVPFTIPIRRLRWALWQSHEPDRFAWKSVPLRINPQTLPDIYETQLYVDLPTLVGDARLFGGWRLLDGQWTVLMERQPDLARSRQQYVIPLAELMSSFRQAQENGDSLCLQIWVCREDTELQDYFVDALYLLPHFESGSLQTEWEDAGEQIRLTARWNWGYMVRHLHLFLWPADMPWLEVPLDLVVSEGTSDYAEWRVPKAKLPGSVEYGGCYLALLAVIDPWSGIEVQRPDPRQEDRIVHTPEAETFYATLQAAVENGTASPEEALMLLSYQYRTQQHDEMHKTNRQLWQYAQQSRLDMEQSVLWADLVENLNAPEAYKLACWHLYVEQAVSNLIDNTSNANLRSRYLSHLPDSLPKALSTAYSCLLEAGFPEVHRQCIASLCRMKEELGLGELLKDVEAGIILVAEAVEVLRPVYDFASDYLMQRKTVDALEILRQLTLAEGKSPKWIEPGFRLYADIGISRVLSIRDIGSDRTMERCWSGNACKLEVETQAPRLRATITTMNLQEYEIQFPWDCVYQCALCEIISGNSHDSIISHFSEQHPYESPRFKEKKPPFKLTNVEIHLPESGA